MINKHWVKKQKYLSECSVLESLMAVRSIPRVVHQTFSDFSKLPDELIEKNKRLEEINPLFEFRYYSDSECLEWIKANYEDTFVKNYLKIDSRYGGTRADYFRYLLIYKVGGIYLDIKSSCKIPFEDIIRDSDECLLSNWPKNLVTGAPIYGRHKVLEKLKIWEFQQWFIIAKPEHPYLKRVIEEVNGNIEKKYTFINVPFGREGGLSITGPIPFTLAITGFNLELHREIDAKDTGLIYSIYENIKGVSDHSKIFPSHYASLNVPLIPLKKQQDFFAKIIISYFRKPAKEIKIKIKVILNRFYSNFSNQSN